MNDVNPEVIKTVQVMESALSEFLNYQVTTTEQNEQAADDLATIKARAKELDALRKSMTKPLDDAKAKIMDFFRSPTEKLAAAEKAVKAAMSAYYVEEQRKVEAQRREQQRQLDELNAKKKAALEAEAREALQSGDETAALSALVEVERLPQEIKKIEPPKPAGVSFRSVWKWKVTDFAKLSDTLKMPNEKAINALVSSVKGAQQIDGIEVWEEKVVASKSGF